MKIDYKFCSMLAVGIIIAILLLISVCQQSKIYDAIGNIPTPDAPADVDLSPLITELRAENTISMEVLCDIDSNTSKFPMTPIECKP